MGVYGMLALALAFFSLRNIIRPSCWKEKWVMTGFWGLNIGLMGMILVTLVPVGGLQAIASFERGFWWARSFEFYAQPLINRLLWLRMIPDTIFIVVGILPLVAAALHGIFNLRRERKAPRTATVWVPDEALVTAPASGD
jgi:nitric oxide reductase subunit B